ncbi:MAG: TonB family protein [Paludibacteraceae bacterium]|nr:TonB family protein [Paludibacteraceae bacterium]
MDTKKSLKADLENKRTLFALIGLVLALGFTYICFEWTDTVNLSENNIFPNGDIDYNDTEIIDIPVTKQEKPKEMPKAPTVKVMNIITKSIDSVICSTIPIDGPEVTNEPLIPLITTGIDDDPEPVDSIYLHTEKPASFPGDLPSFLRKELVYPIIAKENGVQGRVYVQFVVNRDGSIQDVIVAHGIDPALDQEAIRVVKKMPKWNPAEQNNMTCRSRFTLPILFRLK